MSRRITTGCCGRSRTCMGQPVGLSQQASPFTTIWAAPKLSRRRRARGRFALDSGFLQFHHHERQHSCRDNHPVIESQRNDSKDILSPWTQHNPACRRAGMRTAATSIRWW